MIVSKGLQRGTLSIALALLAASTARAEVEFTISSGPYYVDSPITLTIKLSSEPEHTLPTIPAIDGADVGDPVQSRQSYNINGQVTQSVVYQYQILPFRAGELVIPSISVNIGGETRDTNPRTLTIQTSDSGDLLFVEVHGNRESIYLGESLEVTLEVWMKPFLDRRNNFGTTTDMQNCIDFRNSTWGEFGDMLSTLRSLPVRRAQRANSKGEQQDYYVYNLRRTVTPQRTGPLSAGNINIIVTYPLRIERDRRFFFSDARITKSRTISDRPQTDPVIVKPIPTNGQPPWYNGAVGRFGFEVTAKPTEVHVGDPITLTMSMRGSAGLDLLQPPKLSSIAELAERFRIPDEMLAGEVQGNVKRFTQTIRARDDATTEIPPIPFTYFDTTTEKFVTLRSDSIPITVKAAEGLAVSSVVESNGGGRVATRLTKSGQGILANYTDIGELQAPHAFAPGWGALAWAVAPPLLLVSTSLIRRRWAKLKHDVAYASRRTARSTALRAIAGAAATSDPREEAALILNAITHYAANRCGLDTESFTRAEAIRRLRDAGVAEEKIAAVDELLTECEAMGYAGASTTDDTQLAMRAKRCVGELEKERF